MLKNQTEHRIAGFDGLRGISAVMVAWTHINLKQMLLDNGLVFLWPFVSGNAAVTCFYILSGFLITRILVNEYTLTGRINLKRFLINRSLRLYPLYYLVLLLMLLSGILGFRSVGSDSFLFAFFYIYNFVPKSSYDTWLGAFHSLATEEQFYLIYPLVFGFIKINKNFLICVLCLYILSIPVLETYLGSYNERYFVGRWGFIAGYQIALGCVMALCLDYYDRVKHLKEVLIFGMVSAFLLVSTGLASGIISQFLVALAFGGLILFVFINQRGFLVRFLEVVPLKYLGKVSYGVYVWQAFYLTTGPWKVSGWPLDYPYNLMLLIVTVPLSWHFYESKFLRLKQSINSSR